MTVSKRVKYEFLSSIRSIGTLMLALISICMIPPIIMAVAMSDMANYANMLVVWSTAILVLFSGFCFIFMGFVDATSCTYCNIRLGITRKHAALYVILRTVSAAIIVALMQAAVFAGARTDWFYKMVQDAGNIKMLNDFISAAGSPSVIICLALMFVVLSMCGALIYLLCVVSRKVAGIVYFGVLLIFVFGMRSEIITTKIGAAFMAVYTAVLSGAAILPLTAVCLLCCAGFAVFMKKANV